MNRISINLDFGGDADTAAAFDIVLSQVLDCGVINLPVRSEVTTPM